MRNRKIDEVKRQKKEQALRQLWPEAVQAQLSFKFVGDLEDYDTLSLQLKNDFTCETRFFPMDQVSGYLRGNLIQEYYVRGIRIPKQLLGGM